MKLSIVSTMFRSAPHLREFYLRVCRAAEMITDDFEIILVNDGSPDDSLAIALKLLEDDARVRVVDLSRNFGHHKAMMTGLAHAREEFVFLIDCDLEEQPELLGEFYELLVENRDVDVVHGIVRERGGSWFRRLSGYVFYSVFNWLSDLPIPRNLPTVRLMTQRYVQNLVNCRESEIVISGLWEYTGFNRLTVPIDKTIKKGSTYSLRKRLSLAVRSITGFSRKPLIYICYLGALILVLSTAYLAYVVAVRLFGGTPPTGYTSLVVSVWFLGGLILFCLGIVAIYLSVVFIETKGRPYTVIRQLHERTEHRP